MRSGKSTGCKICLTGMKELAQALWVNHSVIEGGRNADPVNNILLLNKFWSICIQGGQVSFFPLQNSLFLICDNLCTEAYLLFV